MLSPEDKSRKIRDLRSRIDAITGRRRPVPPLTVGESPVMPTELHEVRRKIQPVRADPDFQHPILQPIRLRRDIPLIRPEIITPAPEPAAVLALEQAVQGRVSVHPSWGAAFVARAPLRAVSSSQDDLVRLLSNTESPLCARIAQQCGIPAPHPSDLLFLDIETTGLAGSPLFLIGTMQWDDGGFVVHQFLARTYAEEASVIAQFLDSCVGKRLLVSFNGKSFDVPYIRMRAAANLISPDLPDAHLDLLRESRRRWKHELPDCKLQTLERRVCGRTREDDIPGSDIPRAYHDFVRTENAWRMVEIIKHNHLDIVTMAELLVRMGGGGSWT